MKQLIMAHEPPEDLEPQELPYNIFEYFFLDELDIYYQIARASPGNGGVSTQPETVYKCETCSKVFSKKVHLTRHAKTHTKPVTCHVHMCTYRTAEKRDMLRHIDVNHPEYRQTPRSFCPVPQCKGAREGFSRPDHLTRHMGTKHPDLVPPK
jgi:hypothetical protein